MFFLKQGIHKVFTPRFSITGLLVVMAFLWAVLFIADAVAADGQAFWCPDSSSTCTDYGTIQGAVDAARADREPGTISVGPEIFDESVSINKLKDVMLIADIAGGATITGSLSIERSTNISVVDLIVRGGINIHRAKGAYSIVGNTADLVIQNSRFKNKNGTGLTVSHHGGSIALSGVSASRCGGTGALLDSSAVGGDIAVSEGKFDKNGASGLNINTGGAIRLVNVCANKNQGAGANLNNILGSGGVDLRVSGSGKNTFDRNRGSGLWISSAGTIALIGIRACKNGGHGAELRNSDGGDDLFIEQGFSGGNRFDRNGGTGLFVGSRGGIYLTDVSASGNGGNGLDLSNWDGRGSIEVDTWACNLNKFEKNGGFGLLVNAAGSIKLTDIKSNDNINYGASLDNRSGSGNVTIRASRSRLNNFNKNGQDGIWIQTNGAVSVSDIDSSSNAGFGLRVDNTTGTGDVILETHAADFNLMDRNGQNGLDIRSKGAIVIIDLSAAKNTGGGILLDNELGSGDVTIGTAAAKLNMFDSNVQHGLWVRTTGAIDIADVSASKNGLFGASLAGNGVSVTTVGAKLNRFDQNGGEYGLRIYTEGGISLIDVSASSNTGLGAYLRNPDGTEGVTVATLAAGANLFEKNGQDGLYIESGGVIGLEQVNASQNGRAHNCDGVRMFTIEDATLTCSTFNRNTDNGISASLGFGDLYLNSVTATGNTSDDIAFSGTPIIDDTVACP
jgi:hypothetical protein